MKEQVLDIKDSLFPAIMKFVDDDHWQIEAQGKMTPLLSTKNVIFAEQKNVPAGEPRLIVFTDGHVERKR